MHYSITKYIEVKHYFVRDYIANENIELNYVEFKSKAYIYKTLIEVEFSTLRRKLILCKVE